MCSTKIRNKTKKEELMDRGNRESILGEIRSNPKVTQAVHQAERQPDQMEIVVGWETVTG